MNELVKVEGVTKRFKGRRVLDDVSFSVRQGEVLGLIGPNGAGKTTLFECLSGLLAANGGTIKSKGQTLPLSHRKQTLKVLGVDGRSWLRGQPAGGLAEKARSIYGARNEEFIDNVKAWAYFPYAVARDIPDFHDGDISIRFKIVAGQLDQCAGILFNLKPNGDYLTVRFNGMEDNVVLWTFNKGVRKFVKRGSENVPLARNQWHTLQISVHGTSLQASLNGKHLLDFTLAEPVSGKVGVWSKTDSVSYFDDYTVNR